MKVQTGDRGGLVLLVYVAEECLTMEVSWWQASGCPS